MTKDDISMERVRDMFDCFDDLDKKLTQIRSISSALNNGVGVLNEADIQGLSWCVGDLADDLQGVRKLMMELYRKR